MELNLRKRIVIEATSEAMKIIFLKATTFFDTTAEMTAFCDTVLLNMVRNFRKAKISAKLKKEKTII